MRVEVASGCLRTNQCPKSPSRCPTVQPSRAPDPPGDFAARSLRAGEAAVRPSSMEVVDLTFPLQQIPRRIVTRTVPRPCALSHSTAHLMAAAVTSLSRRTVRHGPQRRGILLRLVVDRPFVPRISTRSKEDERAGGCGLPYQRQMWPRDKRSVLLAEGGTVEGAALEEKTKDSRKSRATSSRTRIHSGFLRRSHVLRPAAQGIHTANTSNAY